MERILELESEDLSCGIQYVTWSKAVNPFGLSLLSKTKMVILYPLHRIDEQQRVQLWVGKLLWKAWWSQKVVLTMRNNPAPLAVQRKATEEEGCGSTSVEFPIIMQDHGQPADDVPRGWRRKWGFSPKVSRFAKIKRASRAASQMKSWVQFRKKKEIPNRTTGVKHQRQNMKPELWAPQRGDKSRALSISTCPEKRDCLWLPFFFLKLYWDTIHIPHNSTIQKVQFNGF